MSMHKPRILLGCLLLSVLAGGPVSAAPVVLAAGKVEGAPGKEIVVAISLKNVKEAKGVRALSMRLNYDPAIVTYKSVEKGPALTRAMLGDSVDLEADPGKLALGFVCDFKTPSSKEFTSVEEDGVVLKVTFTINADAKAGQKCGLAIDNYRVVDTANPPFELLAGSENGEIIVVGPAFSLPWIWILIGFGVLLFVLLLIALLAGRGKKEKRADAAVPSFAPEGATMFAHACVQCGGVIQLPRAMMGQKFKCSACGTTQTAGA